MSENLDKTKSKTSLNEEHEMENSRLCRTCEKSSENNAESPVSTEWSNQYLPRDFNNEVLDDDCYKYLMEESEEDYMILETTSRSEGVRFESTNSEKFKNSFDLKDKERHDDLDRHDRQRSSLKDSNDLDLQFEFNNLSFDEIPDLMKTEPTERKPYPVIWLEHSENMKTDYYNNYEQKLQENKFDLETFSADRSCESYLQSDTTGKCFLIVRDSWGKQFLEKKIETSQGTVRIHDHHKLSAIYVYASNKDNETVDDTVPTLEDQNVINNTHSKTAKRSMPISTKLSCNGMTVNHCTSVENDHTLNLQKKQATPNQRAVSETIKTDNLYLLEQSNNQTSIETRLSKFTSCLRKCCCCLCNSNSVTDDTTVSLPLLSESSRDVIQKEQPLTVPDNNTSNQSTDSEIDQNSAQTYQEDWTRSYPKIRGFFTTFEDLLVQMCNDQIVVKEEVDNLLKVSIIKYDEASVQPSEGGNCIWFQIFIEALRRMNDDRDAAKAELLDLCRLIYKDDKVYLNVLNKFEQDYKKEDSIRWYTENTCFFRLINKALRYHIYDSIIPLRLLINDITTQLQGEHEKQQAAAAMFNSDNSKMTVYRGQLMRRQEFKDLSNSLNKLVSVNSFFSATQDYNIAIQFFMGAEINEKEIPLLMIIDVDRRHVTGAYAKISQLSAFRNEREVLFSIGCIFRIKTVHKRMDENFHTMEIELCSQDDNELKDTYNYLRDGLPKEVDFTALGDVLFKMHELRLSEKCHKRALNATQTSDLQRLRSFVGLAHLNSETGKHDIALRIHKQVLAKQSRLLSPNDKLLGITYTNIGIEYYHLKELDKALYCYEKARKIFNECYPANHPIYCQFANNVAVVYAAKVEYDKAKEHLDKADRILKAACVPEAHPDTATILANIGVVYSQLQDADKALDFQQRAFDIRQRILPSEHIAIAHSSQNLAILHESRNDNQLALLFYKEALRIKLSCLSQKSPEYRQTWEYYTDLCQKIQDSNTMGIVIVGPPKSGKSSFGNILVGANRTYFDAHRNKKTVESTFCYRDFADKHLIIIDTPSILVDYTADQNNVFIQEQIKKCNAVLESYLRSILIVISGDMPPNEIDINLFFQQLIKHFGEEAVKKKSILIITHLDQIAEEDGRTISDHLQQNPHLKEWIDRCNGYYFDGSKLQAGVDVDKRSDEIVADIIERIRLLRTF